jgi:uncharacterized protein YkwD
MSARALLLAIAALLLAAPAAKADPKAEIALGAKHLCVNTDVVATPENLGVVRDALACLHNRTRAERRMRTLVHNRALAEAAVGHAQDMVARGYFEHSTPEGERFDERIMDSGYARRADGWKVGENLIWATGDLATPAQLMDSWLASSGHRANILTREYRELGLGLTYGTPGGAPGVTIAAEFGTRRR